LIEVVQGKIPHHMEEMIQNVINIVRYTYRMSAKAIDEELKSNQTKNLIESLKFCQKIEDITKNFVPRTEGGTRGIIFFQQMANQTMDIMRENLNIGFGLNYTKDWSIENYVHIIQEYLVKVLLKYGLDHKKVVESQETSKDFFHAYRYLLDHSQYLVPLNLISRHILSGFEVLNRRYVNLVLISMKNLTDVQDVLFN
jgi:hypothetical protein